jgi:hypothetical protein
MDVRHPRRAGWRRFTPRTGARAQLVAAAVVWLVGTAILLVRGVASIAAPDEYERFGYGIVLIALAAVAIGIVKARVVLVRYATRAVTRIRTRGHACFFGLFAWSSWAFIAVMMGGGLLLRHSPLVDSWWGRTLLGVIYIAVGTALAIADIVFWRAALGPLRVDEEALPHADTAADDSGHTPPAVPRRTGDD